MIENPEEVPQGTFVEFEMPEDLPIEANKIFSIVVPCDCKAGVFLTATLSCVGPMLQQMAAHEVISSFKDT